MSPSAATGDSLLGDNNHSNVREWLKEHHRKQLAVLDKFLLELRLGRLTRSTVASDRRMVVRKTVELLKHIIGATRWNSAAQLLSMLRGLGRELYAAGGFREPAIGNVVRRIMAAVREEALHDEAQEDTKGGRRPETSGRYSLESMLWALPQHVKQTSSRAITSRSEHQRQESLASEADLESDYPPAYYSERPDLKQAVMESIQEIVADLEDLHKNINDQATNHIHSGDILLTCGPSKTVEFFLKAAAAKRQTFQVIVCEGAPHYGGHEMAKSLAEAGIDTIVVPDAAIFAVMARVNKVLLPAHAVLANGGLIASSGCNTMALAAHHNSVPTVCVTGMFKLCPMFPHEGQDTLNDLVSPSSVIEYAEMSDRLLEDVEFVNPVHDYIKPEHISLYVTNVGSFQPSFIYRLLAEYYHTDDWESFE